MSNCCGPVSTNAQPGSRFRKVLWFALIANAAMFVVEILASVISGSASLQADALDFFGDAANYAITLFVLGLSIQVRARAALFKGATMAVFGLWVLGVAVYRLVLGAVPVWWRLPPRNDRPAAHLLSLCTRLARALPVDVPASSDKPPRGARARAECRLIASMSV